MAHSDPTLQALYIATEAAPENLDLRAAYADALLKSNLSQDALTEAQRILARRPDHIHALKLASAAAEQAGETLLSQSYIRMIDALGLNTVKELLKDVPDRPFDYESHGQTGREQLSHSANIPEREMFEVVQSDVNLSHVAGLEAVKRRLWLSFLGPVKDPQIRAMYKKSLRGGLLLYGPPGCGKTFVGRALAGELGASFINIGISDVLDQYIGVSEQNVHQIFLAARQQTPCVLFFDEIDALGRKRSLTRDHAGRSTINQLLSEMDGVSSDNEGIYIVAATNHPWDVDSALRRPGRFDRTVLVLPPDLPAREHLLLQTLSDRPHKKVDFNWLAKQTNGFSGADLVHLVDSAAEFAIESALTTGNVREIEMDDLKKALKDIKPSTRTWMETAKNFAMYSNDGGIYDDLIDYMKSQKIL